MSLINTTDQSVDDIEEIYNINWICQIIAAEGICGVFGNIVVCFVILRAKFLHNMTNYLLINLAVADGLICLQTFFYHLTASPLCNLVTYVPASIAAKELFCRLLASSFLGWMLAYTTAYSLCMITLERYVAILHPLHYACKLTATRIRRLIALIWVMSILFSLPFLFTNQSSDDPNKTCSGIAYPHKSFPIIVSLFSFLLGYLLPIVLMGWAYYEIQVTLKRQAKALNLQHARAAAYDLVIARQRLVSVLTIVLGALIVLWTPLYITLLFCLHPTQDKDTSLTVCSTNEYILIRVIARALFYLNSVINPIIYEFKYKKFRQGFKVALCCCCSERGKNRVDIGMVPL